MRVNWSSPLLPFSAGKLQETSCRHSTSKSAKARASSTMRGGSTRSSQPRHHWMFQVTSFTAISLSTNAGAHERLDELALEQKEAYEQRRRGHERRGRDDRPVDALVARREHLQADGERPRLDRVGDDERPQEIIPVVAERDQGG